jgi:ABC-type multidrug transport system ATPase subunit
VQVSGEVTYNGYGLDEFVPQKTAAYISQNDVHDGEMTVKEVLDFSARCQGVGQRYGERRSSFVSCVLLIILTNKEYQRNVK